jgi:hypothetical protein
MPLKEGAHSKRLDVVRLLSYPERYAWSHTELNYQKPSCPRRRWGFKQYTRYYFSLCVVGIPSPASIKTPTPLSLQLHSTLADVVVTRQIRRRNKVRKVGAA